MSWSSTWVSVAHRMKQGGIMHVLVRATRCVAFWNVAMMGVLEDVSSEGVCVVRSMVLCVP